MRLSNTLMMNESLLPTGKKAFTLAEVLITLSILGVVAALTIPSLVNRQSDLAAQVKLKKAIANYENVAAVYMVENEATNLADLGCANLGNYFKVVETLADQCQFTTADGVVWTFSTAGNAVVVDSANAPRYGVVLWAEGGVVNSLSTKDNNADQTVLPADGTLPESIGDITAPIRGYYAAADFLNAKASELSSTDGAEGKQTDIADTVPTAE